MSLLRPGFSMSLPIKIMFNLGCLLDVPTGMYMKGRHGEHLLLGGLGGLTGIVGHGNNFKSTVMNYMATVFLQRINGSTMSSYDTEINIHEERLMSCYARLPEWDGEYVFETGRWTVTDSTQHTGDEYFDILKEFMQSKIKDQKKLARKTPFLNRSRSGYIEIPQPTGGTVDSLSEFKTNDVIKMQDDNSLGDSKGNTIFLRQGIQKNRFLMELPGLSGGSHHYMLMTAHIGDKFEMDPRSPSMQKLQHLKGNVKLKGVPEKFTFLMNNCWHAYGASTLTNQGTKAPEYPSSPEENAQAGSQDLNVVRLRQLRGKSGQSGYTLEIVVSQSEGVLPSLTEFNYIKSNKRFGLTGSDRTYQVVFLPELNLSRTTVRAKIDEDPKLRRALNILAELSQIKEHWRGIEDWWMEPEELYTRIKDLGYDWDEILSTRGYWTLDNDDYPVPYLSTRDLCEMAHKRYVPFWMDKDKIPEACRDIKRERVF